MQFYESYRIKQSPPTQADIERWKSQADKIFEAFTTPRTMAEVSRITGIERASICRRVDDFRKEGTLRVIKVDKCPITKFRAQFFTTDRNLWPKPRSPQTELFG